MAGRPGRSGRPKGSRNIQPAPEPVPLDFPIWLDVTKQEVLDCNEELLEQHPTLREAVEGLTWGLIRK